VYKPEESFMSDQSRVHENLVIGGGLAGAMAALRLTQAGREVVLFEKERSAHHKVCGEFLSPEAVEYLRMADLDPLKLGAVPIESLRLAAKGRVIQTRLPFRALSLSRCVLDAALLERVENAGCGVWRGAMVQALAREGDRWTTRLADGTTQRAHNVFLATGKHDLHGWNRPPGKQNDLVGFKMHWRLRPEQCEALRGFMDLFLFGGGYGGLALVEEDIANFCFVIRRSRLRQLGDWRAVLAALLQENALIRERLDNAVALCERPIAVSSIPYGHLPEDECQAWCVGDQAAVIPSFTGDGMAIALHSGALAAEMYMAGSTPSRFHQTLRGQLRSGMAIATVLSQSMVSRAGRILAPSLIPILPQPIAWIAKSTRIPSESLMSGSVVNGSEFRAGAIPH
jgi:flavin-dependent dehydrogenase